jgi:hypothetical protein
MYRKKFLPVRIWLAPLLWTGALAALFFMEPGTGASLCVFRFTGMSSCPGCRIGHSIHHALNLDLGSSLQAHILGIPSAVILLSYCFRLIKRAIKTNIHGPENAYDAPGTSATGVCHH